MKPGLQEYHTPRVSVLIPFYNTGKFLVGTIKSVLDQTFTDFELLLCDDCSTDNSLEIARSFDDPRIRVITNEKNMGSGKTRNKLASLAVGEYCAVLDSDDVCLENRLQTQVDFLDSHPQTDICSSAIEFIDENGNRSGKFLYNDFETHEQVRVRTLFTCAVANTSLMYRRERYNNTGLQYEEGGADDMSLYSRAVDVLKFHNIPEPLVLYRMWSGNFTSVNRRSQYEHAVQSIIYRFSKMGFELSAQEEELLTAFQAGTLSLVQYKLFYHFLERLLKHNETTREYDHAELKGYVRLYVMRGRHKGLKWYKSPRVYYSYKRMKIKLKKI